MENRRRGAGGQPRSFDMATAPLHNAIVQEYSMSIVTQAHIDQYNDRGFFVLERVIPAHHLDMLREECARYIGMIEAEMDRQGADVIGINHRGRRYFISNRYKESPYIASFIFSEVMADICRATLGPNAYLFHEQYVVKAAEKGMKFGWHQDSGYVGYDHKPYLTCWCTLDDVTIENGTVFMLPYERAGTRTWVKHTREEDTNDLLGYFGNDPGEPVIAPAGSIACFSSVCFHRSGMNATNRMRRIYLPQYSAEPIIRPDGKTLHAFAEPFLKDGQIVADIDQSAVEAVWTQSRIKNQ
jgi:ectoine hydroxylase-related dioxygenase (phytanoyl-CoA dioxygenase family)